MAEMTLGKTGITVDKNGFGALPIQRVAKKEAVALLRRALDGGVTFYDTARGYTDSEEKLGEAFGDLPRNRFFLATKTPSVTVEGFWKDLETSLGLLRTGYVDIYQFHNPDFCPKPGDGTGLYEAMLEAKRQAKIRFTGITNHRMEVAREAIASGLYDILQYPFSYLSDEQDLEIVRLCGQAGMGFLGMKSLAGGLVTNAAAAYAYLDGFPHVLPIWGIQRESELEEFLSFIGNPPALTPQLEEVIRRDREQLQGGFCRGCGYCLPCPAGIEIHMAARMSLMIRRSPSAGWLAEGGQAMMGKIQDCIHCGQCADKCPYNLDTPALLEENYQDYREILAGKVL